MTLGEVWPSFPDEGGAVQLSTLGGQEGGGVQGHDGDWEKYFDKKTAVPPLSVNAHMGHRSFLIFSLEQ